MHHVSFHGCVNTLSPKLILLAADSGCQKGQQWKAGDYSALLPVQTLWDASLVHKELTAYFHLFPTLSSFSNFTSKEIITSVFLWILWVFESWKRWLFSLSLQFPRSQSHGQVTCSAVSRMEFSWAAGEGQSWFLNWCLGAADLIKAGLLSVCVLKSAPAPHSSAAFLFCAKEPRDQQNRNGNT